ncbi:MAG: flagellar M-ring protein FliF [Hyphomonadaceae bacterium]|nr:flagellar M-ring protein FliF [Hyphomonadaceae bacterium]
MADPKTDESKSLVAQLARSGRMRIAAALVVVALVGGGLGVIMLRGDAGGQKLLFSGLDLEEASEITNKLDTAGVPYTLEGGGSAVFVPADKVEDARMMLSEQGLPTRGSIGWEIFDKSDALGETQFVLNIKQLRAMEGELERTISAYDMVQSARVHLSVPDRPLFQQNSEKPKASVVLKITGNIMSPEKVRAIRNIVASQVPGLAVGAVTVASTDGRLLAAATDEKRPQRRSGRRHIQRRTPQRSGRRLSQEGSRRDREHRRTRGRKSHRLGRSRLQQGDAELGNLQSRQPRGPLRNDGRGFVHQSGSQSGR